MSTRTEEGLEERPTIGAPEEIEVVMMDERRWVSGGSGRNDCGG